MSDQPLVPVQTVARLPVELQLEILRQLGSVLEDDVADEGGSKQAQLSRARQLLSLGCVSQAWQAEIQPLIFTRVPASAFELSARLDAAPAIGPLVLEIDCAYDDWESVRLLARVNLLPHLARLSRFYAVPTEHVPVPATHLRPVLAVLEVFVVLWRTDDEYGPIRLTDWFDLGGLTSLSLEPIYHDRSDILAASVDLQELTLQTELPAGWPRLMAVVRRFPKLAVLRLQTPELAPDATLLAVLPNLRHLEVADTHLAAVLSVVAHPALEHLALHSGDESIHVDVTAVCHAVASHPLRFPALRSVSLDVSFATRADRIEADAAGTVQMLRIVNLRCLDSDDVEWDDDWDEESEGSPDASGHGE